MKKTKIEETRLPIRKPVWVTPALHKKIKLASERRHVPMIHIIEQAYELWLSANK